MNNIALVLALVSVDSLLMNLCQKSTQKDVKTQEESLVNYHSLGCDLLPAAEYSKIPAIKLHLFHY